MVTKRRLAGIELSIYSDGKKQTVARLSLKKDDKQKQQEAMHWRYVLAQRHRWSRNETLVAGVEASAQETCRSWGIDLTQLKKLAQPPQPGTDETPDYLSSIIEVSIPYQSEGLHWWARVMPWEYLLSAATKPYRAGAKRWVVRRLVLDESSTKTKKLQSPTSFSILEAAPGPFRNQYDFSDENALVRGALHGLEYLDLHGDCGSDPHLSAIGKWLHRKQPSILHLTGVDAKLGNQLLGLPAPAKDGLFLAKEKAAGVEIADGEKLAQVIFGEARNKEDSAYLPQLVAFNLWHSAARLAPLAVAHGAGAAMGFENTFDDNVAERFFAQFYRHYNQSHWNLPLAFIEAFKAISPLAELNRGTGIVLWTRDTLLVRPTKRQSEMVPARFEKITLADPGRHRARDLLSLEVVPHPRLNYANLHNRASIFDRLKLALYQSDRLDQAGDTADSTRVNAIRDVEVQVSLSAGGENFPYRTSLDLVPSENVVDLARDGLAATENHGPGGIFIPLTSTLMRSVDESILTSVHVAVTWHEQTVFNRTFPIQLAPVDEWRFEDDQIVWMPSFIYPRDAAVARIIDAAQRYLVCLSDDFNAGFGGYQAYDPDASDPWRGVDLQVQAIWTALALDFGLGYINPPPSYSDNAQRLRTPTRILEERRGTCVDLALLVAACLEWVEIYPVIFNLNDHAFPGYWRDPEAYQEFQGNPTADESETLFDTMNAIGPQRVLPSWYSPRNAYPEIRNYVQSRLKNKKSGLDIRSSLVPMETVFLTQRSGVGAAVGEAEAYFSKPGSRDFHSMIDVIRSRSRVTPIPLSAFGSNGSKGAGL